MTILNDLIKTNGNNFIVSGVWDFYNSGNYTDLLKNNNSLISKDLKKNTNKLKKGVTFFTGAKGRSQHSKTNIIIFFGEKEYGVYFSYIEIKKHFNLKKGN